MMRSIKPQSMKLKCLLILLICITFISSIFFINKFQIKKNAVFESNANFNSFFWLKDFKDGPELLDPHNIEFVSEYYILENLSCGLVRDSKQAPSGYVGCIAERFFQSDRKTWIFKIRKLKWSDGTDVTKYEIQSWITGLKNNQSRHIQFMNKATYISYDEESRELKIGFHMDATPALLHELSLADAGLFPTNYKSAGWQKTIGPYVVKKWSKVDHQLILSANLLSPLYNLEMPQEVELRRLNDPRLRSEVFKSIKTDFVPLGPLTPDDQVSLLTKNAPQIYVSHPTFLLFFILNKKNKLANDPIARMEFEKVIELAQSRFISTNSSSSTFKIETQMIPEGFDGRLHQIKRKKINQIKLLKNRTIRIRLANDVRAIDDLYRPLVESFAALNIQLQSKSWDGQTFDNEDDFAGISAFHSNQREPSGSWSFLLYSHHGVIHPWLENLSVEFTSLKEDTLNRFGKNFYLRLHEQILALNFTVPYLIGSQRYLLSARVDPSEWNKFDSRVRFYELKMRK